MKAFIDYLSFTFRPVSPADAVISLCQFLTESISYMEAHEREGGIFGYKHSFGLFRDGNQAGMIAWGGNKASVFCSLSGVGCGGVDMRKIHAYISQLSGIKITRADIAHDDFEGVRDIRYARLAYQEGLFTIRGVRPSSRFISDEGNMTGCTFYVGKRENGKQMRVYEKGKQLGDKDSPWVRWEVELHNVDRVIPLELIIKPEEYLKGSYPVTEFLIAVAQHVETIKKTVEITFDKLKKHARDAYGKFLNVCRSLEFSDSEIIEALIRPGVPRRLAGLTAQVPVPI